jgi:hypothetical protein
MKYINSKQLHVLYEKFRIFEDVLVTFMSRPRNLVPMSQLVPPSPSYGTIIILGPETRRINLICPASCSISGSDLPMEVSIECVLYALHQAFTASSTTVPFKLTRISKCEPVISSLWCSIFFTKLIHTSRFSHAHILEISLGIWLADWSSGNADSYSGGTRFELWLEHWLSWLMPFVTFLSNSIKCQNRILNWPRLLPFKSF